MTCENAERRESTPSTARIAKHGHHLEMMMIDLKTVSSFPCLGYLTPIECPIINDFYKKSGLNSTNERRDVEDQRLREREREEEEEEEEEAEQVDLPF
ncbi:hypothetical protein RUM43_012622 [Polyplax serrata]|uniref:Uncharacterized protein n=1 Tax=Polyplax serrata TaxID=468196 RepID=A0AAN8PJD4_POLSC